MNKEKNIQSYIAKEDYIYSILKCPKSIKIPTNDFKVWENIVNSKLKSNLWVYNKLQIALSQNIECGPLGIYPQSNQYPVLLKPIINLYGMGKDAIVAHNLEEYRHLSKTKSGLFWMKFLTGPHHSIDIACERGTPKFVCTFLGIKGKQLGTFDRWETIPKYTLPKELEEWITKNLKDYTGWINLETIGNKIIECHLRIGDINQVDLYHYLVNPRKSLIFPEIINFQKTGTWSSILKEYRVPKIFLIPVFISKQSYLKSDLLLSKKAIYALADKYKERGVFMMQKDPPPSMGSNPPDAIRICNISCVNLESGLMLKDEILQLTKNTSGTFSWTYYVLLMLCVMFGLYVFNVFFNRNPGI